MKRLLALLFVLPLAGCGDPLGVLDKVVPWWGYQGPTTVSYGKSRLQAMDVYKPEGAAPKGGFPILVFFYGGRWQGYFERTQFRFIGEAFASQGYVVVLPDYRQYPEVMFPVFVEDGAKAVQYAWAHAKGWGANPDRLFLAGHSAGGHVAAMLATDEHFLVDAGLPAGSLKATAGMAGPYDFLPFTDDDIKALMGPSKQWPASQPIKFVDGREAPMWLAQGKDDQLVGAHNAHNLAAKLREAGTVVETKDYDGVDHYKLIAGLAAPLRLLAPVREDMLTFFAKHDPGK